MKNGFCWFSLLCSNSNKVAWGIWSLSSQRILQTDTRNITSILVYYDYFEVNECYFENVLETFSIKGFSQIGNNLVRNFQSNHKSEYVSINIRYNALHRTILYSSHFQGTYSIYANLIRFVYAVLLMFVSKIPS